MPKAKQVLTKAELKMLTYIFLFQPIDKSLLRLTLSNYDFAGRIVKSLFDKHYISETLILSEHNKKEPVIQVTREGEDIFLYYFPLPNSLIERNKNKIKGDENKYRQYKLSSVILMFSRICPSYPNMFVELEKSLNNKSNPLYSALDSRSTEIPFIITNRELRDCDDYNLRKITATRANGVAVTDEETFVLYNHNRKRMRIHGDFEEKFKLYTEIIFPNKKQSAIHFGKSYKVAIDTILKTSFKNRATFILTNDIYYNNFYVPLTVPGAKQMELYFIKDSRKKISSEILTSNEILTAQNTIYDGEAGNNIIYLGFHCDISEIERLFYLLETVKQDSFLNIYCFEHQKQFYENIFNNRARIIPLSISEIFSAIKK